jgi:dTDP-4-amino-4,6-dideoxygalactose transaminase
MADMGAILKIAAKCKLYVLEDCAQSTGATYYGAQSGTLGDFGAFSFYPSKNLGAFGDGGAVSTNSKEHFDRLVMLRNYGQSKRYHHDILGINSRLDEIQSAILSAQIPFVSEWNDRRFEIASRYNEGLRDVVQIPNPRKRNEHVYHLYVIQVDERDALQSHLNEHGIQTLIHYPIPAHLQKAYQYLGYKPGDLPVTERVTKRILSLPMYPELTNEQVDLVIDAIKDFYAQRNSIGRGALHAPADPKAAVTGSATTDDHLDALYGAANTMDADQRKGAIAQSTGSRQDVEVELRSDIPNPENLGQLPLQDGAAAGQR